MYLVVLIFVILLPYAIFKMIYYTQLIFIKQGYEEAFHSFEEKVLPLLKEHNGELVYRIRPDKNSFIESSRELPYEIHLVVFNSKVDFERYKTDPKRLALIDFKNNAVKKVILIEGVEI